MHDGTHRVVPSGVRSTVVHGVHASTKPHQRMLLLASLMQRPSDGVQKRPPGQMWSAPMHLWKQHSHHSVLPRAPKPFGPSHVAHSARVDTGVGCGVGCGDGAGDGCGVGRAVVRVVGSGVGGEHADAAGTVAGRKLPMQDTGVTE